jgi:acyl carrier protein
MTPGVFVPLASLPLTPNGKVDRKALPAPGASRLDLAASYVAPRTPVEEILAAIWAESLGVERVGIDDNFFVLGGDSMRSVRIVSLARERGLVFTVQDLFRFPAVRRLAGRLEADLGIAVRPRVDGGEETAPGTDDLTLIAELEELSDEEVRELLKSQVV